MNDSNRALPVDSVPEWCFVSSMELCDVSSHSLVMRLVSTASIRAPSPDDVTGESSSSIDCLLSSPNRS